MLSHLRREVANDGHDADHLQSRRQALRSAAHRRRRRRCWVSACWRGAANVIMQLARPGVGYGVMESRVESGRIDRHPIKRARTTFTYLAVAAQAPTSRRRRTAARSTVPRPGVFDRREPGGVQRVRQGPSDVGRRLHLQGLRRHLPALRRRDATTRLSTHYSTRAWRSAPPCRCRARCGRPTGGVRRYWEQSLDQVHIDDAVREYLLPDRGGPDRAG